MEQGSEGHQTSRRIGKKTLAALALFALAFVLLWILYFHFSSSSTATTPTYAAKVAAANQSNAALQSPAAAAAASKDAAAPFNKTYTNRTYGFSFRYPDALGVGDVQEAPQAGTTTSVLIQNTQQNVSIQIYITAWTEPDPSVTASLVEQNLPDINAHNFQPVTVGGITALSFSSADTDFGDSMQVWFVRDGTLYQISTYAAEMPLLSKILSTWHFTNGV